MLTIHNKMLDAQITQQASYSSSPSITLPSKPKLNPSEQCNAMILRGTDNLRGLKGKEVSSASGGVLNDDVVKDPSEVSKDPKHTFPKPYIMPSPFPQKMANTKLDIQFGKFLEVLNKLYINIPLTNALSQMSSYAKLLKKFCLIKES